MVALAKPANGEDLQRENDTSDEAWWNKALPGWDNDVPFSANLLDETWSTSDYLSDTVKYFGIDHLADSRFNQQSNLEVSEHPPQYTLDNLPDLPDDFSRKYGLRLGQSSSQIPAQVREDASFCKVPAKVDIPTKKGKKLVDFEPWKRNLVGSLGRIYKSYMIEIGCRREKAQLHLNHVANEDLAKQLIHVDASKRTQAAQCIHKIASRFFKIAQRGRAKEELGDHLGPVIYALARQIGRSYGTALQACNKHLNPTSLKLLQDPETFDQGIQELATLYHIRANKTVGMDIPEYLALFTKNFPESANAPDTVGNDKEDLSSSGQDSQKGRQYIFPDIISRRGGSGPLGNLTQYVSRTFQEETNTSRSTADRRVKDIDPALAQMIAMPSTHNEGMHKLIDEYNANPPRPSALKRAHKGDRLKSG